MASYERKDMKTTNGLVLANSWFSTVCFFPSTVDFRHLRISRQVLVFTTCGGGIDIASP